MSVDDAFAGQWSTLSPAKGRVRSIDFSKSAPAGVTLSDPVFDIAVVQGTDADAGSRIDADTAELNGTVAGILFTAPSGITCDVVYRIGCTLTGSDGSTPYLYGHQAVRVPR